MKIEKSKLAEAVKAFKEPLNESLSEKEISELEKAFLLFYVEEVEARPYLDIEKEAEKWTFEVEDKFKNYAHLHAIDKEFNDEYLLFSDEEAASEYGRMLFKDLWDSEGYNTVNWDYLGEIVDYAKNFDKIKEITIDDRINYFNELTDDEQKEELKKYNIDPNISDVEYEYAMEYIKDFSDSDYLEYWQNMLGNGVEFQNFIISNIDIDVDAVYDAVERTDGVENLIAQYDGTEHALSKDGYIVGYAYRIR